MIMIYCSSHTVASSVLARGHRPPVIVMILPWNPSYISQGEYQFRVFRSLSAMLLNMISKVSVKSDISYK